MSFAICILLLKQASGVKFGDEKEESVTDLMTTMFVEQRLALTGSAYY